MEHLQACFLKYVPGCAVWSDLDITGGKWSPRILERLDEASALVLLGTPSVLGSIYSGFELGFVDKRLGASKVFILRAGLSTSNLQTRPPLGEFQNYDCEEPTSLRLFFEKISRECNLTFSSAVPMEDFARDTSEFKRLVELELKAVENGPQIARPRVLDASQLSVPIVPAEARTLLRARHDIESIESYLGFFDRAIQGGDMKPASDWYEHANQVFEARRQAGVPDGNLRARFERLSSRLLEAANLLLQGT